METTTTTTTDTAATEASLNHTAEARTAAWVEYVDTTAPRMVRRVQEAAGELAHRTRADWQRWTDADRAGIVADMTNHPCPTCGIYLADGDTQPISLWCHYSSSGHIASEYMVDAAAVRLCWVTGNELFQ